jgi:hypothetical protein
MDAIVLLAQTTSGYSRIQMLSSFTQSSFLHHDKLFSTFCTEIEELRRSCGFSAAILEFLRKHIWRIQKFAFFPAELPCKRDKTSATLIMNPVDSGLYW